MANTGGGSLPQSGKWNLMERSISTFSVSPASTILSMIFCFDCACFTKFEYVPQEAMNSLRCLMSDCEGAEPQRRNQSCAFPSSSLRSKVLFAT